MRTLFIITLLILVVGAISAEDHGKKALFSTWAPWFSKEVTEDVANNKKATTKTTMTSKRRKDGEDKPKEISSKKMKKIVDPKSVDGGKCVVATGGSNHASYKPGVVVIIY
jgi:hypothetical protein